MNLFKQIEQRIDEQMKRLLGGTAPAGGRELIEIHRAILDDVLAHVESLPRGRRVFPYDRVAVTIPVLEESRRAAFQVAFVEGNALGSAVRAFLEQDGCELPAGLRVEATLAGEPMPDFAAAGFHIRYGKAEAEAALAARPAEKASPPAVRLAVLSGQAAQDAYELRRQVINVGRLEDLFDARQRLIRRNDVAFSDAAGAPNNTVSRAHAHLRFEPAEGVFRLFDDGSAHGTSVFRDGRLASVPPGGRGWKLASGDEIYFGQARVRFELE